MPTISFQYPAWFVVFCVLAGAGYAAALYFRDKRYDERPLWQRRTMAALRFLSVTLLCLLLMGPLIKSTQSESKKPIVVLAQDNSESAAMGKEQRAAYQERYNAFRERLSEKYEVRNYLFGSRVRESDTTTFTDKSTNISALVEEVYDLYANQNLGALVLATDGIFNEGYNPLYTGSKLNVPVYSVALGDTTPRKDLYLKKVFHNNIAYLGDKFTVEADIAAYNCVGGQTRLTVSQLSDDGAQAKVLSETAISVDKNDFFKTQQVILETSTAGVQRYRITLSTIAGEATTVNNSRDIYVEVLDARQKILVLANAPHPDLGALKQLIDFNKNYQVNIEYVNKLQGGVDKYDFVILHQVPGTNGTGEAAIATLKAQKIPRMFILGAQSNLSALAQAQQLLSVRGNINQTNDVEGRLAKTFSLFTLGEKVAPEISRFPPLIAPFGEYAAGTSAQVLLNQKIGTIETQYPLLLFGEEGGGKVGVLAAEGIWKWRVFDYLQHQNFDIYNDIIGKTIQYLSTREDKRRFRVFSAKTLYNENEAVSFDAELYNASYELINQPDAFLVITNGQGKKFNYTFARTEKAYQLPVGFLPPGNYSFEAQTTFNNEVLKAAGKFSVQPVQLEQFETTADHNLLRSLAAKTGGSVVLPASMSVLADSLLATGKLPVIRYETSQTRSFINLWWIFFLIFGLLAAEWFYRKYWGAY